MSHNNEESREQILYFQWVEVYAATVPEAGTVYAIPNAGAHSPIMGAIQKKEGLRTGFPDTCLPVARGGYATLFLEFKPNNGTKQQRTPKPLQLAWHGYLRACGNRVEVVTTWQQAEIVTRNYLGLPPQSQRPVDRPAAALWRAKIHDLELEARVKRQQAKVRKQARETTKALASPETLLDIATRKSRGSPELNKALNTIMRPGFGR